jgi:hypothetical protein
MVLHGMSPQTWISEIGFRTGSSQPRAAYIGASVRSLHTCACWLSAVVVVVYVLQAMGGGHSWQGHDRLLFDRPQWRL